MRTTSPQGRRRLMLEEGTILSVYSDAAGVPTVCTGHMMRPQDWGVVEDGVTHEECDEFLRGDLAAAEAVINKVVDVDLTQNQFDALVSFQFNTGAITKSSVLRYLNLGNYELAAESFMLWVKRRNPKTGALVVDEGLVARRNRERTLFLLPDTMKQEDLDAAVENLPLVQFALRDVLDWSHPAPVES
jgi:lysozyme